ncbi:hypothetical protein R3P38DRAFT_3269965 [Favolaschia claudopus]|uniref:Uncharacterized protein n=1 Tax=Favolaschia claudopus TaxID=2862362 RepID=A0AAW0BGI3_9AGAR
MPMAALDILSQSFPPKTKFTENDVSDLTGKVCIVTGGNSGVGKETIRVLLNHNAKVYMASRNQSKAEEAIKELEEQTGKQALFLKLDLGDLKTVKASAAEFLSKESELHILFNNGGVMMPPVEDRTADGYDLQVRAVRCMRGGYVLSFSPVWDKCNRTILLHSTPPAQPPCRAKTSSDGKARVVNTSSAMHLMNNHDFKIILDDKKRKKAGAQALYALSKFAFVAYSAELARRYGDQNLVVTSLHPGVIKTDLHRHMNGALGAVINVMEKTILHDVSYGALTQLYAGTSVEGAQLNGKDESRVTFDGTGISVFDLKRDIILANNMGKANDFDLFIYDSSTNKEYTDDSEIIPRSSSVVVKRRPAVRPGKGKASMYIAGAVSAVPTSEPVQRSASGGPGNWHKGAMSKRFDIKEESPAPQPSTAAKPAAADDDEASAMEAMFKAQSANWEETQAKMSHAQRIYNNSNSRGTGFSPRGGKTYTPHQAPVIDRPLPPSYVCYRCGQKGHWIQDCPTNNDRDFDHRPRIKRTTGIPRSMLKAVENPNAAELGQGVMVTPDGGFVVAQPDSASWQKQLSTRKGLTVAEVRERTTNDPALVCPIDHKLFRDAVKTPCCGTHYCEECVQTHLLERDFVCPNCSKKIPSLDKLIVDKPMRTKVLDYIENAIEESKKEGGDEDPAAAGANTSIDEQDIYDQQTNMDMSKIIADSIPQLQAQIAQISTMLQNPSLPPQVRHNTQIQHNQLQIQLAQAQEMATAIALAGFQQQQLNNVAGMMQGFNPAAWTNTGYPQQQAGQDSAYQRLPVNNRRRVLKRDRPAGLSGGWW